MIYKYSVSESGTDHIKNGVPCQDYCHIAKCSKDIVIAAVADGLGSALYSDVAAKKAAEVSVNYCKEKIALLDNLENINTVLTIIRESFNLAQDSIEKEAKDKGHSINEYDTTLTLGVMYRDMLYYGHSGDSGIIALTVEGSYEQVTKQQRDEEGKVFCLFFRDKWIFNRYEKEVCSVLLATDGMFETFFPCYIENEPINIRVTLAQYFMDNRTLRIDEFGEDKIETQKKDYILNISDKEVSDDKTIVVMVNTSIKSGLQPNEYYIEPDWSTLIRKYKEEWNRKAYPHLFKGKDTEVVDKPNTFVDEQSCNHVDEIMPESKKQDCRMGSALKIIVAKEEAKDSMCKGIIKSLFKLLGGKKEG